MFLLLTNLGQYQEKSFYSATSKTGQEFGQFATMVLTFLFGFSVLNALPHCILILTETCGVMIQIICYTQERPQHRIYITVGKQTTHYKYTSSEYKGLKII